MRIRDCKICSIENDEDRRQINNFLKERVPFREIIQRLPQYDLNVANLSRHKKHIDIPDTVLKQQLFKKQLIEKGDISWINEIRPQVVNLIFQSLEVLQSRLDEAEKNPDKHLRDVKDALFVYEVLLNNANKVFGFQQRLNPRAYAKALTEAQQEQDNNLPNRTLMAMFELATKTPEEVPEQFQRLHEIVTQHKETLF